MKVPRYSTSRCRADLQDRLLPAGAARLPAGSVNRGDQGAGLRPQPVAQCVMGVMLKSQLEQAAGFLDQQINLGRAGVWTGESPSSQGSSTPNRRPRTHTSSKGTFRMGVPLISRIRSPTWMEFFTSGLMQPGSTLWAQSGGQTPAHPARKPRPRGSDQERGGKPFYLV